MEAQKFITFEKRVLKRIFGPTRAGVSRRQKKAIK
jgi:hypothetical protein